MSKNATFKVGDKIIELDSIFEIFKIDYIKGLDGKKEQTMFYKTYFREEVLNPVTCSLPIKNLQLTDIRKPLSKSKLIKVLKNLKNSRTKLSFENIDQIKDLLKTNDLYDVVRSIKILQKEKHINPEKFNRNKKVLLESAIKMLVQEYAIVNKTKLENARQKIEKLL